MQVEATVRTGHVTTDWFQIGKGVCQGCILSPCLFNLYSKYITKNTGLDEAQAGLKIAGRNINNLRYADDTTLIAESEEELKSILMKVNEESEKVDLKLNIQKTKVMASGPITSWQIDGETVSDFIFWDSKITADSDCIYEIKRHLLLGRKVIHWKDWCWSWNFNTLASWCEKLTHLKRPWCWQRLQAGGEGDNRGWDGWMESPTRWTWVWVNSGGCWWTERPGVLQSMGSQTVGHNWATELNWLHLNSRL